MKRHEKRMLSMTTFLLVTVYMVKHPPWNW
jgi:hypothetical protein